MTMCLDRVKRGRGPVVVKTLIGVLFVLMVSSLHSIFKIHKRSDEFGSITPTDQVLVSRLMLEASLMGKFLSFFLLHFKHSLYHGHMLLFFWTISNLSDPLCLNDSLREDIPDLYLCVHNRFHVL